MEVNACQTLERESAMLASVNQEIEQYEKLMQVSFTCEELETFYSKFEPFIPDFA